VTGLEIFLFTGCGLTQSPFLHLGKKNNATPVIFFLVCIVGEGWNQGPLNTAATLWPIVSAPGDYDNGEIGGMIGRRN
jgi:hypothetical protein